MDLCSRYVLRFITNISSIFFLYTVFDLVWVERISDIVDYTYPVHIDAHKPVARFFTLFSAQKFA